MLLYLLAMIQCTYLLDTWQMIREPLWLFLVLHLPLHYQWQLSATVNSSLQLFVQPGMPTYYQ